MLFRYALAALPALALAQQPTPASHAPPASDSSILSTVTTTSITQTTVTIVMSNIATVTADPAFNATETLASMPTASAAPSAGLPGPAPGSLVSGAGSLDANRVALAGLAAVLAVAML